jgi:hypothetical protein
MLDELTRAILLLEQTLRAGCKSPAQQITKADLQETKETILMKISEVKTAVAEAAAKSEEAFAEVSTRIAALQTQIDALIAGNTDPDITDAAFADSLRRLKISTDALADIVPNPPA